MPGVSLKPLLLAVAVILSGCATIGELEAEAAARERAIQAVNQSRALQDQHTGERISLYGERWRDLEARVRYLEQVVAPNDPDGLLEDPDLYRDDSERRRFYRLWERTECGE